ncbi:MAG: 2-C-methyl-D-erythritol 2,4-cyclodiphosphate synthase [Phycisphaerales bacterium]|nr:MAG: 2-C-methyl-D-erythritol 2,4-cyclodiphosphate synthase [Phycisphaerales bacterium]
MTDPRRATPDHPAGAVPGGYDGTPAHPDIGLRIGMGYDLHRLEPLAPHGAGRPLVLAGVPIEHDRGPVAHSDGDALYHAITDALLGALAQHDIGALFPDDDPRHESADSAIFLDEAVRRVHEAGWRVVNADCVVVLERPRIGPHRGDMRRNIAARLMTPAERIGVKGKTHERVDAVGEGRAVETHAVVLLARAGAHHA